MSYFTPYAYTVARRPVSPHFSDAVPQPLAIVEWGEDPGFHRDRRGAQAAHPPAGGAARYPWSDTGLDADEVRAYQNRYAVPSERLR